MKRIRILEPFPISETAASDLLRQLRARYGAEDLELSVAIPGAWPFPQVHESHTALALAAPELIRNAIEAESEGVDGIMVDCMADPGVDVMRESVSIPVLGPGHTSMHVAALLGRRFSLLVTTDFSARYFLEQVNRMGLGARLASCQVVRMPPEEIGADEAKTLGLLVEASREAILTAQADTLILSCTGFAPFSSRLREKLAGMDLAVPLVDPFAATINALAALIAAGLSHSRIAYPDNGIDNPLVSPQHSRTGQQASGPVVDAKRNL